MGGHCPSPSPSPQNGRYVFLKHYTCIRLLGLLHGAGDVLVLGQVPSPEPPPVPSSPVPSPCHRATVPPCHPEPSPDNPPYHPPPCHPPPGGNARTPHWRQGYLQPVSPSPRLPGGLASQPRIVAAHSLLSERALPSLPRSPAQQLTPVNTYPRTLQAAPITGPTTNPSQHLPPHPPGRSTRSSFRSS